MIVPVIIAGGSGSRLWPLSRDLYPKQFLALRGGGSLLEDTVTRLRGLDVSAPSVICNEAHRFLAAEQLRRAGADNACIMLEPEGRNTAPAITLGVLNAMRAGNDPLIFVMSSDHCIRDVGAFEESVRRGMDLAEFGSLVTFGVMPEYPETGYGYIECGEGISHGSYRVRKYLEKPDYATAESYLNRGDVLWNSGMFLFRASVFIAELEKFEPDIVRQCRRALEGAAHDLDFLRVDREAFVASPAKSVDYAVMERTDVAAVTTLAAGWSDIGSWQSVWASGEHDGSGNVLTGDVVTEDVSNCLVHSEHGLVATLGLDGISIVVTRDAVLVADRNRSQDIRRIVDQLRENDRSEYLEHREVYRPWGSYDSVDAGSGYQVKRITVNPGGKLSLQMHRHRAEHWIVVSGAAHVTNGDQTYIVRENESTYIPVGRKHSLENRGSAPLHLIEVQSGAYLGEDDIVRFEDIYGRV